MTITLTVTTAPGDEPYARDLAVAQVMAQGYSTIQAVFLTRLGPGEVRVQITAVR